MYKYTFTFMIMLFAGLVSGQGWERVYGGSGQDVANGVAQTPDGGYIMTGSYNGDTRVYLLKTDANGELQWSKTFFGSPFAAGNKVIVTQDGGYAVVGYVKGEGPAGDNIYVLKTDVFGNLLWKKPYGTPLEDHGTDILELPDGNLVVSGYQVNSNGKADLVVLKLDSDGGEIWYKTYGQLNSSEKGMGIVRTPNDDLVAVAESQQTISSDKDAYVVRITSTDGTLIWENTYGLLDDNGQPGSELPRAIVSTTSDDLVMTGSTSSVTGGGGFIMKIDGNGDGTQIWSRVFPNADFFDITNGASNTFFVSGNKNFSGFDNMDVVHADASGQVLWEQSIGKGGFDSGYGIVATADGGATIAGRSEPYIGPTSESNVYLVKTDANGLVFTSYLEGHIFKDANLNCIRDNGESNQENWIVKIEAGGFLRYAVAKADGSFRIAVDTGTYDIALITPNNYWKTCEDFVSISIPDFYDTVITDIPVQVKSACPRNEVDIATPILRRCAENTYTVRYCNSGTVTSSNTYVEVKLDPAFSLMGSSIVGTPMGDNMYRFDVGTLQNGNCGSFNVKAFLGCETAPGETFCTTAHIYPDSFCDVQTSNWDGAIIVAQGICENDSVKLILANIGPGSMTPGTTLGFVIAEDVVMLTAPGDPAYQFNLTSGQQLTVWDTIANGKTYRIIAEQSPGYPGLNTPTAAVEGCQSDTSTLPVSLGFYTMFPEGDADAFVESDCQESFETDYHPISLKRGHPKGYNEENFVTPDTDLEFLIQFSNTGTDLVHEIVIVDTLSAALDPATVYPGAASHPYQFDIYGEGIVQFTLSNVNLEPGSSAGEGYVKFRVKQRPNLPCETQILNSAATYFDYGAPKISNQTLHTVCEFDSFIIVKTTQVFLPSADLRVYPNPARDVVNFELSGVDAKQYSLQVYDIQGRLLVNQIFNQPTFRLLRPQLPAGTLFYWLAADGKPVASGKLLIH